MKLRKKIISILLVVAMLITNCNNTITAFAKDTNKQENMFTTTSEDISVGGTNSFGSLLSEEIQAGLDEQEANDGCNVFAIEMSENVAKVSFETTQRAILVVGIYDEAGNVMLATGKTQVVPGETLAYVDIDVDVMPQYFYLRGFLIEEDSMRPLCTSYESPNYTQEMQEFLAMTTDDFDADKVLNFDDSKSNNFAVYSDETILIPKTEENNQVAEVNEENHTYVIENINEHIRTLKTGDVFAYEYEDGNVLLVKIASISIDGSTATITGEETSLEEVFDYVKIDETSYTQDVSVDDSTCDEGVVYEGEVEINDEVNSDAPQMYGGLSVDESISTSIAKKFSFLDKKLSGDAKLSGNMEFQVQATLKVYISFSHQYMEVKLDYKAGVTLSFSGSTEERNIPLAYFKVSPVPGVDIGFTPSFVVQVSAKLEISGQLYGTIGFSASHQEGVKNLTTTPQFKAQVKGEVTLFVGISMEPKVTILSDNIAEAKLTAKAGAEVKGTLSYSVDTSSSASPDKVHDCSACVDGDITAKASVSFEAKFLNFEKLTFKLSDTRTYHIADFYYSFDYGEFEFTSCPHDIYKTTFTIYDTKGKALENTFIKLKDKQFTVIEKNGSKRKVDELKTNSQGKVEGYLPSGTYYATIDVNGYTSISKTIIIEDNAKSISEYLKEINENSGNEDSGNGDGNTGNEESCEGGNIVKELFWGDEHRGAITKDGSLYMWGNNENGQIGNGSGENQLTPIKVLDNVASVSLWKNISSAITEDGSLYMWGNNYYGQVGNGGTKDQLTPIKVLDNVASVSLWFDTCSAITKDGSLYIWGNNEDGQIGNGSGENQLTPIKVLDNVVSMSLCNNISSAITEDGSLYMWGKNDYGQVGNGGKNNQLTPIKVLDNVVTVSQEWRNSAAITEDGSLYMWGNNCHGQIGNGGTEDQLTPIKVLDNATSVSLWFDTCSVITKDGSLYMWGQNEDGQIGNGSTEDQLSPVKVLDNVVNMFLESYVAATTEDGNLYMWGTNGYGEIGNGSTEDQLTPIKVLDNVETVFPRDDGSIATITKDRSLYMWGNNENGQIGNGSTEKQLTPVKVLNNVISVSDGWRHNGVITEDGSLYMWGHNYYGQIGNGSRENQLTPIKVLDNVETVFLADVSLAPNGAITKDGNLYMWGENYYGQVGNDSTEDQLTPVKILLNSSAQQIDESQNVIPLSVSGVAVYGTGTMEETSFTDLLPNETYNFYVMKDSDATDAFASSNLLYLSQVVSDEEGKLSISYQPTEQAENTDVFVVPMKQTDLSTAQVELENLSYTGEMQYVNPIVTLDGNILQEGKDYELLNQYSALEPGDYTVMVHGIGLYTGEVSIAYKMIDTIGAEFRELLQQLKDADEGTMISVEIKDTTVLPKEILNAIQGKDVTLALTMKDRCVWNINGKDLSSEHLNDINLSVIKTGKEEGNLSVDVITSIAGTRDAEQLIFSQKDSFGFMGEMKLDMTDGINAEKGVLLQNVDGELKLADSSLILKNTIAFDINQGADSAIVYGTNGDVDGDDAVTIKDMMQILYHISGNNPLDELQKGFADVDMSGTIDIQDVMRELYYISGRSDGLS